ncbi:MAG: hypothetical protein V1743_03145, partial [Nanoarchaeota archaeon]
MADIRRIVIVFVIAVLFTIFVFSLNWAVNQSPSYTTYCRQSAYDYPSSSEKSVPPPNILVQKNVTCPAFTDATQEEKLTCSEKTAYTERGFIEYTYDINNCPTAWTCQTCQLDFTIAQSSYKFWEFIIAAVFGLIAIIIGLYLPTEKSSLNELIGSGFLIGGLLTLFIGTGIYWEFFPKNTLWLRPAIILFELLLVIYIAYKKLDIKKKLEQT